MSTRPAVLSLYRRSLKLSLDWAVNRQLWRGQALYIRSLFEKNRDVHDPRQLRVLLRETEKLLDHWKHPDPFVPPLSPGGKQSFTCDRVQVEVLLMSFRLKIRKEPACSHSGPSSAAEVLRIRAACCQPSIVDIPRRYRIDTFKLVYVKESLGFRCPVHDFVERGPEPGRQNGRVAVQYERRLESITHNQFIMA